MDPRRDLLSPEISTYVHFTLHPLPLARLLYNQSTDTVLPIASLPREHNIFRCAKYEKK